MTSYQKLKAENIALQHKVNKILDEPEFYLEEKIKRGVYLDVNRALWFGDPSVKLINRKDRKEL